MRGAYAFRRPVVNAYLVRERDRRRLRELLLVLAVAAPVAAVLLGYVWLHNEILETGYEVDRLENEAQRALRREGELRLEAAYLTSPERLERRAAEELGMRYPRLEDALFERELP